MKKSAVITAVILALALAGCSDTKTPANSDTNSAKTTSAAGTKAADTTTAARKKETVNEMPEHDMQDWEDTSVTKVVHKTGNDEKHLLTNDEKWLDENGNVVKEKLYDNDEKEKPELVAAYYYAYTYDENGNILKQTECNDPKDDFGNVTVYQYSSKLDRDGKQRLLKTETYSVNMIGGSPDNEADESWEWTYNHVGDNVKCEYGTLGSVDYTIDYSYEYDEKDRPAKIIQTKVNGKSNKEIKSAWTYEHDGDSDQPSKKTSIDPKTGKETGESNTYKYNKHGDETERVWITKDGEEWRYTTEYDEQNRVIKEMSYKDGKIAYVQTYSYKKI